MRFARPFTLLMLAALPGFAWADPPKVVETIPRNGDRQVDPSVRELRVVFDRAMNTEAGYSVVGGGELFPQLLGKPRWIDDRTFVSKMRLKPDHDYRLGINGGRFLNFRGADGQSSVPYPIQFRTNAGPAIAKADENREAVEVLRQAIDQDYSYFDLRKVDWDAAFRAATPKLLAADSPEAFAREAASLIAPAGDLHFYFKVGNQAIAPPLPMVAKNFDPASLKKAIPGFERKGRAVFVGKFPDGISYVMIASWQLNDPKDLDPAYEAIADADGAKGVIVDVRPNGGGNENLAREFAGCFVDSPKVYSKHSVRSGGKFLPVRERVVGPTKSRPRFRGKVAVLMGPGNVSSCESFLLMMKQVPGCLLVGEKSRGSSGNPQPVDLGNGVVAFVPSWKDFRPDGICLEGEGVLPDREIKADPDSFAEKDPVLAAALKQLRGS